MQRLLRPLLLLLLLLGVFAVVAGAADEQTQPVVAVDTARQELLNQQSFLAWQRINEARLNPKAVLRRLGISRAQARNVLGDEAWILDRGLPPLAWNGQLRAAVDAHSRDMFNRIYYSHVTPEGLGPAERVAATGYQALAADETLAALIFEGYVDIAMAVDFMIDTMLWDELTGTPGVQRNIFSTRFTEVGVAFSAESLPLIDGSPYVYLYALDFAEPQELRSFLVGTYDPVSGRRPAMMPLSTGVWDLLPLLSPGLFQTPYPQGGAALVLVGDAPEDVSPTVFVYDAGDQINHSIDLRVLE